MSWPGWARRNAYRVFLWLKTKGDDSLVSAKVSYFSGWRVIDEVNQFLAENSYEVEDVHIQFVTTRVQTGAEGGDVFQSVDEVNEAYVTHPA